MLLVFTVICGIIYPVVMLGISQVAFHNQANGSLVSYHGHVVGSSLLCQEFVDAKGNPLPQYFQPRPSARDSLPGPQGRLRLRPHVLLGIQPGARRTRLSIHGHHAAAAADRGVRPRRGLADPAGRR